MSPCELIRVSVEGPETTVSFPPEVLNRLDTAQRIASHLCDLMDEEAADAPPVAQLNLDLKLVDRLASDGFNRLLKIKSKARSRGIRVVLMDVQASVREVFQLTRLERAFEFANSAPL